MKPGFYQLPDHYRGDTFEGRTFTIYTKETDEAPLVPMNLTGADAVMQVRYGSTRGEVAIEFSIDSGGLAITEPLNGELTMNEALIDVDLPGKHYYDIQITPQNGDTHTYIYGTWNIHDDVTRIQ